MLKVLTILMVITLVLGGCATKKGLGKYPRSEDYLTATKGLNGDSVTQIKSIFKLELLAYKGDVLAMHVLKDVYKGAMPKVLIEKDNRKYLKWLKVAAEAKSELAMSELANFYKEASDYDNAVKWFDKIIEMDGITLSHAKLERAYASVFVKGRALDGINKLEAISKLSNSDFPQSHINDAKYYLGNIYAHGYDYGYLVPVDFEKSINWYSKVVASQIETSDLHKSASIELYEIYTKKGDEKQARYWKEKSKINDYIAIKKAKAKREQQERNNRLNRPSGLFDLMGQP